MLVTYERNVQLVIRTNRITENLVLLLNDNVVKLFFSMKTSVDIFWKTTPLNLVCYHQRGLVMICSCINISSIFYQTSQCINAGAYYNYNNYNSQHSELKNGCVADYPESRTQPKFVMMS